MTERVGDEIKYGIRCPVSAFEPYPTLRVPPLDALDISHEEDDPTAVALATLRQLERVRLIADIQHMKGFLLARTASSQCR